jgi:ribosomal protein L10
VEPPKIFLERTAPRKYPEKKAVLYHRYMRLLETASSSTLVFLLYSGFSAPRLVKLRKDIIIASGRVAPSLESFSPSPITSPPPSLTIVRTAIFGAALRDCTSVILGSGQQIASMVEGGLAVLSLPSLDPPQIKAILRALDRSIPPVKPKTEEELKKEEEEKKADPIMPGRRVKRMKSVLQPELKLAGALIEGTVFTREGLQDVAALPTLDTLRAQIVGLLSSPATQLVAVLSESSGGKLARTLEGLKRGLEDHQSV